MRVISILLFLSGLFNTIQLLAQPDFSRQYPVDSIIVYQDCMDTNHYYYHGSQLQVKTEISGKPNFSFVQSRYTGSQRSGNRGDIRFRSFVQVKVRQHIPGNEQVHKIKGLMAESYNLQEIQLSPLRYKYIAARLVCPRIGEDPLISELTFAEDDAGLDHSGE